MYLKSIHIKNIKGIEDFKMEFPEGKEAGWHVLLGANGSGKTTVLRSIALALIGPTEILRLNPRLSSWPMCQSKTISQIDFEVSSAATWYVYSDKEGNTDFLVGDLRFVTMPESSAVSLEGKMTGSLSNIQYNWSVLNGFAAGIGAFRRFTGTNERFENLIKSESVGQYLTLFEEGAALTETTLWLKDQLTRAYTGPEANRKFPRRVLDFIKASINKYDLLPEGLSFDEVSADGPMIRDSEGNQLHLSALSDGISSTLCLALELFRLAFSTALGGVITMHEDWNLFADQTSLGIKGIVLIDEPDAHLHPDWQARIGSWFRKVFPNIQFIVATHSPLVVRAARDGGQIWYLPSVGSNMKWRRIENGERNRLIHGNILDAYSTEVFGEKVERDSEDKTLLMELAQLQTNAMFDKIDEKGYQRIEELRQLLQV